MCRIHASSVRHEDRGVAALEFVLVVPFLLALVFAIASFGVFFSTKLEVTSASRDAARSLALRQTPTYPSGMTATNVVTCAANDVNNNASVTLSSNFTFSIPFINLGTATITAVGTMRCGG